MTRFVANAIALAAALVVAAGSPASVASDCATRGLVPRVVTPSGSIVPGDGGIVVAALPDQQGKLATGDTAVQPAWRLRIGSDLLKPPIESLAPGLAVYRVAVANAFKVELVTDKGEVVGSVRPARGSGDALPAPKLKRATYMRDSSKHGGERVSVELDGDAPATAIALVLTDAAGVPRSWTTVDGKTLVPYRQSDCIALPNGTLRTSAGDNIMTFWVDAGGRKSATSKPIVVQ